MIITSQKLLTLRDNTPPVNHGAVVFSGGTIHEIGLAEKMLKKYPGHLVYRLDNAVLMPGLINVHSHLELPPLLNSVRSKVFPEWVMSLIQAKKKLDARKYKSAAKLNVETLLECGTTAVGEICTHDISPNVFKQRGLRAVVYKEIISMNPSSPIPQLSSSVYRSPNRLFMTGLSPHTPYTVSKSALLQIKKFAMKRHLLLCMHVAESKEEIRLLQRKKNGLKRLYQFAHWDLAWGPKGSSSFEYLNRIGFLSPNLLAVHAVQVTDEDIKLIKKSRTSVAHCPRSNGELGVGRMPLKKFLDAGIAVGLGTDSLASAPSLNMWDEMRYAYRIHKRDGITPRDIFKLATIGGARALGLDKDIGTLELGKKADIIAVPLPKKSTGDLYSDLLRETKSCIMTMVNGKILYSV